MLQRVKEGLHGFQEVSSGVFKRCSKEFSRVFKGIQIVSRDTRAF